MQFEAVRDRVDGIPHMSAESGRIMYDHIRETKPTQVLELGSANGVSGAYIAAAMQENGFGRLLSVDIDSADYDPGPVRLFGGLGLDEFVEFRRVPDSSYNWLLREQIRDNSDAAGNCRPLYDFVFIDGAHEFTIDGLAAVLSAKLLKPGGWMLLDDLPWSHGNAGTSVPFPMSEDQRTRPNVREVWDVIIKQDSDFTEFREQDVNWGWARKNPGAPRTMRIEYSQDLATVVITRVKSRLAAVRTRASTR